MPTAPAPSTTNFVRSACRTIVSVGQGIGGAMATVRISLTPGTGKGDFSAKSHALAHEIMRLDGLVTTAESVTGTVDSASRLAYIAMANPVIKGVAFASGTAKAARRLRGRKVED